MASQVALNMNLPDCFDFFAPPAGTSLQSYIEKSREQVIQGFESGRVLIFDNFPIEGAEYLFEHPGQQLTYELQPQMDRDILDHPLNDAHPLLIICKNLEDVEKFVDAAKKFQQSWLRYLDGYFGRYRWNMLEFSYRFNHLSLDKLHLDIPATDWDEHQFRWFINMDSRPRIITIGPSIFDLAEQYWEEKNLAQYTHLPVFEFIGKLRVAVLDSTINFDREMPRHYLTLDPGSMWLAHSSYTSHGLVFGRKTVCIEGRISPPSMLNPLKHFNSKMRVLMEKGPIGEDAIEKILATEGLRYGSIDR